MTIRLKKTAKSVSKPRFFVATPTPRNKSNKIYQKGLMMIKTHSGSCLCGQVQYEVIGDFESFFLCHCQFCQKDTGSAHAANLFSSSATLKWLSGQDKVTVFNLPTTQHTRAFCSICGSALPYQQNSDFLVVPAGSLDTELEIKPNAHLFVASRANWDFALETVIAYDKLPEYSEN